jgi:hypothetical protein
MRVNWMNVDEIKARPAVVARRAKDKSVDTAA